MASTPFDRIRERESEIKRLQAKIARARAMRCVNPRWLLRTERQIEKLKQFNQVDQSVVDEIALTQLSATGTA